MAISRVQYATSDEIANVTSLRAALARSATAGRMLVSAIAVNKDAGGTPRPSSGWTLIGGRASTSVSVAMAYRVADGSSTDGCTWGWTNAQNCAAWIGEYDGFGAGVLAPVLATSYTNESNVTSVALGPVDTLGDALVLGFVAVDSWYNWASDATWSGRFARVAAWDAGEGGIDDTDVGGCVAERIVTAATTGITTTATAVGGAGDQASGMLVVLGAAVPAVTSRWSGGVTASSATVVATVAGAARGRLVVSTRSDLSSPVYGSEATVTAEGVLGLSVEGLVADTPYYYGVELDGVLAATGRGEFRTMAMAPTSYSFAFASCWQPDRGVSPVWGRIEASGARFFCQLGDLGYPDEHAGMSVAALRASYSDVLSRPEIQSLAAAMPWAHVWDDHDAGEDDAWSGTPGLPAAQQVYRERFPAYELSDAAGIYQTWTCGRARFVLLDTRSHRDHKATTDGPSKTMLGARQLAWLDGVMRAAAEPVIFVVSSVPWNDPRTTGGDAWGGYTYERDQLIASWRAAGALNRIVMLSGDAHMLAADDGTHSPGGIPALQAAPIDEDPSTKGGTFSAGSVAGRRQYGLVTITDTGGPTIRVDYQGIGDDGRAAITMATTFAAPEPRPSPVAVTRELMPLHAHVTGESPAGHQWRWSKDEPDPTLRHSGLRWSDTMPGGFDRASCVLPRKPGQDYSDLREFSTLTVRDAGGGVLGEYRLERAPRVSGERMSVSPDAVGWQAHLEDRRTARIIYREPDLARWGGMTAQRRLDLLTAGYSIGDGSVVPSQSGTPVIEQLVEQPFAGSGRVTESIFDAGWSRAIGSVHVGWQQSAIDHTAPAWEWRVASYESDRADSGSLVAQTPNLRAAGPGTAALTVGGARYAVLRTVYSAALTGSAQHRVMWGPVVVYGDHGLPIYGSEPDAGLLASDMAAHALGRWAPLLRFTTGPDGTIQPTTFPVPAAAFYDHTTAAAILDEILKYERPDWAVWDYRTFHMHARGARGRHWLARVGPTGLEETGPAADQALNAIVVVYQDVDGSSRSVGPPGSGADVEDVRLLDPDPQNPANQVPGLLRWETFQLGMVSTPEGAIKAGARRLADTKQLSTAGSARFVGYVMDAHGVLWPYHTPRAGDTVSFVDAADPSPRRISATEKDDDARTCTVQLDMPLETVGALLARYGAALAPLGI